MLLDMEPRVTLSKAIGPHGEWTAEMFWYDDDRRGPSQVVIRPTDPDNRPAGGLSQTVLREVDFTSAVEEMRATEAQSGVPQIDWGSIGGVLSKMSAGGINDLYLAFLSVAYATCDHQPKPIDYLAAIIGKSPSAIKSHLWHATRNGFLIRSPGRRGGQFTQHAIDTISLISSGKTPPKPGPAPKARQAVSRESNLKPNNSDGPTPDKDAEIALLKSQIEDWKRLATGYAEELDKYEADDSQEYAPPELDTERESVGEMTT